MTSLCFRILVLASVTVLLETIAPGQDSGPESPPPVPRAATNAISGTHIREVNRDAQELRPARAADANRPAGSGGGAAPRARTPDTFQPFVFLHAGDPELGSPTLQGTAARFESLAQRAKRHGAAFIICSGDITHDSSPEQWEAFRKARRLFAVPVHYATGNHDFESAGKRAIFRQEVGEEYFVFTTNNCEFIFANSNLLPYEKGRLWAADGELPGKLAAESREHRKWIEATLRGAQQRNRSHVFLVMHQPIVDKSPVAGYFAERVSQTGVRAVLAGHRHVTAEFAAPGFDIFVTPGTAKLKNRDPERDKLGLGYRVFKVFADRIEQEFVPLESSN